MKSNSALARSLPFKYFCENMRELHVVCAGSLPGVAIKRENLSFPVGKVGRLRMYPMSFKDFLIAVGEEKAVQLLHDWPLDRSVPDIYRVLLENKLKDFYAVGGMPEAVSAWTESHSMMEVETIQENILQDYAADFSKYPPVKDIEKIRWIWDSIPLQLAKENNKFVFSHVKAGKRSAELEDALQWLKDSGLIYQLERVENAEPPLSGAADGTYFKVYLSDVGLLRKRSGISYRQICEGDYNSGYRGALVENYVLNELTAQGQRSWFWRSGNSAEVDFLIERDGEVIPIEVKSADNTRAKSYNLFCSRYSPRIGIKTSLKNIPENMTESTRTLSLPLYMLWNLEKYPGINV